MGGSKPTIKIVHQSYRTDDGSIGKILKVTRADGSVLAGDIVAIPDDAAVISREEFRHKTGEAQLKYLKEKIEKTKSMFTRDIGRLARNLRELRDVMKLDYLFDRKNGGRDFMNETLRDILNLKEDGTMDYQFKVLEDSKDGWEETHSLGAGYHQHALVDPRYFNAKFTNADGREVVFDYLHRVVDSDFDKGTFNYVNGTAVTTKHPPIGGQYYPNGQQFIGGHDLYDVIPYKELMKKRYSKEPTLKFHVPKSLTENSKFWSP